MVRLAIFMLVFGGAAFADKVDDLSRALVGDSSFRVRAQAAAVLGRLNDRRAVAPLLGALRDDNEGVRAIAAGSLGRLGASEAIAALRALATDSSPTVRAQAGRALAQLAGAPRQPSTAAPASGPRYYLALSPIAAGKGGAEAAKLVEEGFTKKLADSPRVTLTDLPQAPLRRFYVDGNIARLETTPPDPGGYLRIDCDVRFVVATFPERSIKLMATVGGSVDGMNNPRDIADSRKLCLVDAAQQMASKVQGFLETQ